MGSPNGLDFSLETATHYASHFLTDCLVASRPSEIVNDIRSILEHYLYQHYAPFWDPKRPKRGFLRRSLTFKLSLSTAGFSLPPGPIYPACVTADIQWFEWMSYLGNIDFDFFVDPGCISFRRHNEEKYFVLWAADWGLGHLGGAKEGDTAEVLNPPGKEN